MKKTTIKQLLFIFALLLGGASSAWADPVDLTSRATPNNELYYVSFQNGSNQLYGPAERASDWDCYAQDENGVKVDKSTRYVECTIGTGDDALLKKDDVIDITYVAATEDAGYWMKLYYNDGSNWVSEDALTINSGMTPSVTANKHVNNTTYTVSYKIPEGSPLIDKKVFRVYVSNTGSSSKGHYVKIAKVLRTGADDCRPNTLTGTSKSWDFEDFNTGTTTEDIVNDNLFYRTGVNLASRTSGTYKKAVELATNKFLTLWVPSGTGKVELVCSSGNDRKIQAKVGNAAVVTLGSVQYSQKIYTLGYSVTEATQITLLGNGTNRCYVHAINVSMGQETVTLGTYGYASYSCVNDINIDAITASKGSVTVYKASSSDGSKVTLESVTGKVPAGTGLILKGTPGATITIPYTTGASALEGTNLLKAVNQSGSLTSTADPSGTATTGTNYVLSVQSGNVVFASISSDAATMKAGQAYLNVPKSARTLSISFEDETTGIRLIDNGKQTIDNSVYDLSGRHVAQPTKGLYIVNGKKVFIK